MAWRNESFRGYADYMETKGFEQGITRLREIAMHRRTAIMCAESLWWRCHRSLISDYLKASDVEVTHIMAEGKSETHPFTSAARIVDGQLSYRGMLESELRLSIIGVPVNFNRRQGKKRMNLEITDEERDFLNELFEEKQERLI